MLQYFDDHVKLVINNCLIAVELGATCSCMITQSNTRTRIYQYCSQSEYHVLNAQEFKP